MFLCPTDPDYDEYCDPYVPRLIEYEGIEAAVKRIQNDIAKTPLWKANVISTKLKLNLYLKLETQQYTGSFLERGVRNTLAQLSDAQKTTGVVTASTGNHGIALSYHCYILGIPCIVVMPTDAVMYKKVRVHRFGAKLILYGNDLKEAKAHAMLVHKMKGMFYINGYDLPSVCEGQGIIGVEILDQEPDLDAVLVPVGGGSLITGIGVAVKHLKPSCEVYGVCTDKTQAMVLSMKKKKRIEYSPGKSVADGLCVNTVGVNTFHTIKEKGIVDKFVVVTEEWVTRAMMHLAIEEKIVAEGAGATPVAALMSGMFPNLIGKKVCCIISGGNVDNTLFCRALERGLGTEGKLVTFRIVIVDYPLTSASDLCMVLANIGVSLREFHPQRIWIDGNVHKAEYQVTFESKGIEASKEVMQVIKANFPHSYFPGFEGLGGAKCRGPCRPMKMK